MSDWKQELQALINLRNAGAISEEIYLEERERILQKRPTASSTIEKIGSYQILSKIGEGGMGTVYLGRHQNEEVAKRQGGNIAIKLMHPQYSQRQDLRERFHREASICLKFDHPKIVNVYDLIEDGDHLAMIMEFIPGRPLSTVIGHEIGPIPWDRAKPWFKEILEAVEYAHAEGVVHRDLKPENIMVMEDGSIKVLDFGIAKDGELKLTKTKMGIGTVNYMAPEQYQNAGGVDHRADIYALGMTLYEMVAGRLPWDEDTTEFEIQTMKARQELPPPTTFYPYIPEEVEQIIEKCLQTKKEDRPENIQEIKEFLSLEEIQEGETTEEESPEEEVEEAKEIVEKKKISTSTIALFGLPLLGVFVLIFIALLFGGYKFYQSWKKEYLEEQVKFGIGFEEKKEYDKALYAYKEACDGENLDGCYRLGGMYEAHKGVAQDYIKAKNLYEKSCDGGHLEACVELGNLHFKGNGVPKNRVKAKSIYEKNCELDSFEACFKLGEMYYFGWGVSKDSARALSLYEKACDGKFHQACEQFRGKSKKIKKGGKASSSTKKRRKSRSRDSYRRSCNSGNSEACYYLGSMYEKGKGGDRDRDKANYYYKKACDEGLKEACNSLSPSYK